MVAWKCFTHCCRSHCDFCVYTSQKTPLDSPREGSSYIYTEIQFQPEHMHFSVLAFTHTITPLPDSPLIHPWLHCKHQLKTLRSVIGFHTLKWSVSSLRRTSQKLVKSLRDRRSHSVFCEVHAGMQAMIWREGFCEDCLVMRLVCKLELRL